MMDIRFDTIGKIVEGKNKGWYIKLVDDSEKSGGVFIIEFPNPQSGEGFNSWLERKSDIEGYFSECNWKIDWLVIEK